MRSSYRNVFFVAIIITFSIVLSITAGALDLGAGIVKGSNVNVRSAPNTSSSVVVQLNASDKVFVLGSEDGWYQVSVNGKTGYIRSDFLDFVKVENIQGSGFVNAENVNMRSKPNTDAAVVAQLGKDAQVVIIGINENWYKLTYNGQTGYVRGDFITLSGNTAASPASSSAQNTTATVPDSDATQVEKLLAEAASHLGTKYRSGGASPSGFDCSGFTSYCFKQIGVSINRTASDQLDNGVAVDRSELQPGDLVFFNNPNTPNKRAGHVGIYVGDGNFIHSSSGGGNVQYDSLSKDYYNRNYIGARRVLTN